MNVINSRSADSILLFLSLLSFYSLSKIRVVRVKHPPDPHFPAGIRSEAVQLGAQGIVGFPFVSFRVDVN